MGAGSANSSLLSVQHRSELVARAPAIRASICIRQKLTLATSLSAPLTQRRLRDPFLMRQLPNGCFIRRQHTLQHR